jgi:serine/threonine-protein kinase HipA
MKPRPSRLDVFFGEEIVGSVHDASPLAFEYAQGWLARMEPMPIAAIPLATGLQDSAAVQAYFENLLPEGELRHYIAETKKASTLFSLLLEVAGDTAGGFILLPAGRLPEPPAYEPTTWLKLDRLLKKAPGAAVDIRSRGARISLAGAQDKASIAIFDDGLPMLPKGASPSSHILKPDIRRFSKVWESAANEAIVMMTAARCGLPTAEVFYELHTASCVVKRFDRVRPSNGVLDRFVQYDLCQLSGTMSGAKYEKEGGPGLAACAELIRRYSSQPAVDLRNYVAWIFFNLYAGNNDSHAKNLSMYWLPGKGIFLTPFYDLMCTRLYPGLSQEFAFAIGGARTPGKVGRRQVADMAAQLGMQPSFIYKIAGDMARKLPNALAAAIGSMPAALPASGKKLAERLSHFILSTTEKTAARILNG